MVREGVRALGRYPGLVACLYAAQLATAALAGWLATRVLAAVFADKPLFDRVVDGDVVALVFALRQWPEVFVSLAWLGAGAVLVHAALSWYLVGGLNATLLARPASRREVAATFGTGGAVTFFAYMRLALLCLIPHSILAGLLLMGLDRAGDALGLALSAGDVARALTPVLLPALLLLWIHWAAIDYARLELSRARARSATRALWRGYRTVLADWRPLAHLGLYAAWFAGVTAAYVLATRGSAMHGASGAVLLFALRQVVAMLRFGGAIVCAGGQAAYAAMGAARSEPS